MHDPSGEIIDDYIFENQICGNYNSTLQKRDKDTVLIENDSSFAHLFNDTNCFKYYKKVLKTDFSKYVFLGILRYGYSIPQNLHVQFNHEEKKVVYSAVQINCKSKSSSKVCQVGPRWYFVKIPLIPSGYKVEYIIR